MSQEVLVIPFKVTKGAKPSWESRLKSHYITQVSVKLTRKLADNESSDVKTIDIERLLFRLVNNASVLAISFNSLSV